jgi:hypothetical protein
MTAHFLSKEDTTIVEPKKLLRDIHSFSIIIPSDFFKRLEAFSHFELVPSNHTIHNLSPPRTLPVGW